VLHDLPGVGANLQDHLQLRLIYRVQGARTLNGVAGTLWGKAWMGLQYAVQRRGPLSMAPSQLGAFARSGPEQSRANLEYHVQPLSLEKFGDPLHDFPAFTASVCNLRPTSRGHVRIVSPDPGEHPEILCNYLSTEADRKVAADSIRLTRRIVAQPALARYQPQEYKPGAQWQSEEDLQRLAGEIGTTIFHPVGTCRMGDDAQAVVDAALRVHGLQGLRVFLQQQPLARVAIFSATQDEFVMRQARALGAVAYIGKSAHAAEMRATLLSLLRKPPERESRSAAPSAALFPRFPSSAMFDRVAELGARHLEILELVLSGCTNQEISNSTGLSLGTVKNYVSSLLLALDVRSRSHLISLFR